jgi:hypothetical protein
MCSSNPHTLRQFVKLKIAFTIISPYFWVSAIKLGEQHLWHCWAWEFLSFIPFILGSIIISVFFLWWISLCLGAFWFGRLFVLGKHILKGVGVIKHD